MEKLVLNSKEHLDASAGVYCAENGLKCRISEDNFIKEAEPEKRKKSV